MNICSGGGVRTYIYAGRLEENKGILQLIEFWSKLPTKRKLLIFGDGTLKEIIKAKTEKCENIYYFGFQEQAIILNAYKNAAAVIIPSLLYESFGMSIPESFSVGTPVISTSQGNPGNIIRCSKGGVAYQKDNYQSFENALTLLEKHQKEFSNNARHYYESNFTPESNYKLLNSIYDSLEHYRYNDK